MTHLNRCDTENDMNIMKMFIEYFRRGHLDGFFGWQKEQIEPNE